MIRRAALLLWLACPLSLAAQQARQAVFGVVRALRDSAGIAGAEVLVGNRKTTTNERGIFRIDSLAPGQYPVTIRLVGYRPHRGRVPVIATEPTELEIYLLRAPFLLPTLIVEGTRTGIHGTVADTAYQPLPGAQVMVVGVRGGEAYTDSLGRFDFPNVWGGPYMVQVSKPGYVERRILVELGHKEGKELAFRLVRRAGQFGSAGEATALFELGRRMAFELNRSRMTAGELARYGSLPLCEVPRVRAHANDPATVWLNGLTLLREVSLCAWRADEVDLVEFGSELRTGFGPSSSGPRATSLTRDRRRMSSGGRGYVIIWEKR